MVTKFNFFDFEFVRVGNFWYFFFMAMLAALWFILDRMCKAKGKAWTDRFVLVLVWLNFALHILKQFFPAYRREWPDGLADSLFPNLCAALILLSPFIVMWGGKIWKDYVYYLGVISGLLVFILPTGAMRYNDFPGGIHNPDYVIETLRFYACHTILVLAGYLMVARGSHQLDYHRIKWIPLTFLSFFALVGLHAILWGPVFKLAKFPHEWLGENGVLYNLNNGNNISNQSMVFGPQPAIDPVVRTIARYIFIPGLQVYYVDGVMHFTPILWMAPILLILIAILGPIMTYPFDKLDMRRDFLGFKIQRAMRKANKVAHKNRN